MSVAERVADLLAEVLSGDPEEMDASFALSGDNRVSPIDVARLAIACEKAFGISLYDDKVAQWRTLGDACRHIEELLEEGQGQAAVRSDEERTAWFYE